MEKTEKLYSMYNRAINEHKGGQKKYLINFYPYLMTR